MYLPMITNAHPVSRYLIGPYLAVVLTDCESDGMIEYQHAVIVYHIESDAGQDEPTPPVMAVAAERSAALQDEHSYFLGVFPGNGHLNMGSSTDWDDLTIFTNRALEIVGDHLNISEAPFLLPEDRGQTD